MIQILGNKCSKSRICNDLDISRASLYWKKKKTNMKRVRYKKESDSEVLKDINDVLKVRPSYGHKRVTAMIKQKT